MQYPSLSHAQGSLFTVYFPVIVSKKIPPQNRTLRSDSIPNYLGAHCTAVCGIHLLLRPGLVEDLPCVRHW